LHIRVLLCAALVAACGSGSSSLPPVQQSITAVSPAIVNPGISLSMAIEGRFETVAGGSSTVALVRTRSLDGLADGTQVATTTIPAQSSGVATRIDLSLAPPSGTPTGVYGFRITSPAGHTVSIDDGFLLVPPASAGALANDLVCLSGAPTQLTASLSNFYTTGLDAPAAVLNGSNVAVSVGGCQPVAFASGSIQHCSSVAVPIPANLPAGSYVLRLTTTTANGVVGTTVEDPLIVDRPDPLDLLSGPVYSAVDADVPLLAQGLRAYHVDQAAPPTATIDGQSVVPTFDRCTAAGLPGHSFCTLLGLALPQGTPAGNHIVSVTTSPGCTASATALSIGAPAPAVAHSDDLTIPAGLFCPNTGRFIVIEGASFFAPLVFIDGVQALETDVCSQGAPGTCSSFQVLPLSGSGPFAPGTHTVEVQNMSIPPVRRALASPVVFDPGPATARAPQPSVLFNGLERQVFVPIASQTGPIASVQLQKGSISPANFTPQPGGIEVTVPAGLDPGVWSILVRDQSACPPAQASFLNLEADFVLVHITFDDSANFPPILFDGSTNPTANADLVPNGTGLAAHYAAAAGTAPWWFIGPKLFGDLQMLRFDLRRSGTGAPLAGGDLRLAGPGFQLESALSPPPQDAWTHYDVSLDDPTGWTWLGNDGSVRPATSADLATLLFAQGAEVRIRGAGFDGSTDASLDEVIAELAH
jgi:hypothetical protein